MLIDRAKIYVKGGDGGNGILAFRREKFVPRGGPSGGDGGNGGSVIIEATESLNTLLHLRYRPENKAGRGKHGEGSNRHGQNGEDMVIPVPVGTVVMDELTEEVLHDFTHPGEQFVVARGGRGGRGNAQFATPTNRAPRHHEDGKPGEERYLLIELKLIADVGLVGLPNAGKSTLISRISAARPKIADYPFTTLEPHLGVVDLGDYKTCVVADIPGLIEGAHEGAGLGDRFLRHIERTKFLVHVVDLSSLTKDPIEAYRTIRHELAAYSPVVAEKPEIVVANKIDALDDPERLKEFQAFCQNKGLEFYAISAAAGTGVRELIYALRRKLVAIVESEPTVTAT
ncbi:MAG: GTPase ObgE [Acidobacteria bacterium]|nr:GTPase ObgE [Acidobacteriota bacterium]